MRVKPMCYSPYLPDAIAVAVTMSAGKRVCTFGTDTFLLMAKDGTVKIYLIRSKSGITFLYNEWDDGSVSDDPFEMVPQGTPDPWHVGRNPTGLVGTIIVLGGRAGTPITLTSSNSRICTITPLGYTFQQLLDSGLYDGILDEFPPTTVVGSWEVAITRPGGFVYFTMTQPGAGVIPPVMLKSITHAMPWWMQVNGKTNLMAGGSATISRGIVEHRDFEASGGAVAGGSAKTRTSIPVTSAGGAVAGGSASTRRSTHLASIGGGVAGGVARVQQVYPHVIAPTGGVVAGGASLVRRSTAVVSAGGGVVGGAAKISRPPSDLTPPDAISIFTTIAYEKRYGFKIPIRGTARRGGEITSYALKSATNCQVTGPFKGAGMYANYVLVYITSDSAPSLDTSYTFTVVETTADGVSVESAPALGHITVSPMTELTLTHSGDLVTITGGAPPYTTSLGGPAATNVTTNVKTIPLGAGPYTFTMLHPPGSCAPRYSHVAVTDKYTTRTIPLSDFGIPECDTALVVYPGLGKLTWTGGNPPYRLYYGGGYVGLPPGIPAAGSFVTSPLTFTAPSTWCATSGYFTITDSSTVQKSASVAMSKCGARECLTPNFYLPTSAIEVGQTITLTPYPDSRGGSWYFTSGAPSVAQIVNTNQVVGRDVGYTAITLTQNGANGLPAASITKTLSVSNNPWELYWADFSVFVPTSKSCVTYLNGYSALGGYTVNFYEIHWWVSADGQYAVWIGSEEAYACYVAGEDEYPRTTYPTWPRSSNPFKPVPFLAGQQVTGKDMALFTGMTYGASGTFVDWAIEDTFVIFYVYRRG